MQRAADLPGNTVRLVLPGGKEKAVDPVELQRQVIRFATHYSARLVVATETLHDALKDQDRIAMQHRRMAVFTQFTAIASGPNALVNMLDMTVCVTLTRMAAEDYWVPEIFRTPGEPMLDILRRAETDIWNLTSQVLGPQLEAELRSAIEAQYQREPDPRMTLYVRLVDLPGSTKGGTDSGTKPDSVLDLLGIDPFSGLDPAAREIAQSRMLAERALFLAQQMPVVLRWQAELLAAQVAEMPEAQQVLSDAAAFAVAADRIGRVAAELPERVACEREQLLRAADEYGPALTDLTIEAGEALASGGLMASNLNLALSAFEVVLDRLEPDPNSEPFRVQDYAEAAVRIDGAAQRLTEALLTLDHTMGSTNLAGFADRAEPLLARTVNHSREVVDHVAWRAIQLIIVGCALTFATTATYRRLGRSPRSHEDRRGGTDHQNEPTPR